VRHLPAEYRARHTWRYVAAELARAAAGADAADVSIALRLALMLENVECRVQWRPCFSRAQPLCLRHEQSVSFRGDELGICLCPALRGRPIFLGRRPRSAPNGIDCHAFNGCGSYGRPAQRDHVFRARYNYRR